MDLFITVSIRNIEYSWGETIGLNALMIRIVIKEGSKG